MANGKCWFYPLRTVRPPILPMPLRFPRKPRSDLGSIPTDPGSQSQRQTNFYGPVPIFDLSPEATRRRLLTGRYRRGSLRTCATGFLSAISVKNPRTSGAPNSVAPVNELPSSARIRPWHSATSALWCLLVHYPLSDNNRHVRRCHRHRRCRGTLPKLSAIALRDDELETEISRHSRVVRARLRR